MNATQILVTACAVALAACALPTGDRTNTARDGVGGSSTSAGKGRCGPPHNLAITDIEFVPERVMAGQSVDGMRLTFRTDRNGECATTFTVRDGNNAVVARTEVRQLAPGRHSLAMQVPASYKFSAKAPCFHVVANVKGNGTGADETFEKCARPVGNMFPPRWTF